MNYTKIIIVFLLIITLILSIVHIVNPKHKSGGSPSPPPSPGPSPSPSPSQDAVNNLKDLYNNIEYDKYGIPQGGFLVSMLNTYIICPKYSTAGPCDKICYPTLDIGDINKLMTITSDGINKKGGAGTNCLSLDTTYFRSDLQPYAFGPLSAGSKPSQDFVIGIIIDVKKIWSYIACMFTVDSGSIARYNNYTPGSSPGKFKQCSNNDKKCWTDYLNSEDSKYLGFSGCGHSDYGLTSSANSFFVTDTNKFIAPNSNNIQFFAFSDSNRPFSKFEWKDWVKSTKVVNKLTHNESFLEKQCFHNEGQNNDGYRENEVDIIVPSNTSNFSKDPPCNVTEDFKKIWIDSILGIFTNAGTNCSQKNNIAKSCFRCDGACCCNEDYHVNVVKNLVNIFNKNNKKKINGFKFDTLSIYDIKNTSNKLNISLID